MLFACTGKWNHIICTTMNRFAFERIFVTETI